MKKIVFLVAISFFLKPLLPVLDYIVNYKYVSIVLCENKAKPELKCNGKCHLMKELAKASESEKPLSNDKKDNSKQEIEVLFFQEITTPAFNLHSGRDKSSINATYSNTYVYLISNTFFHPPSIIS